MSQSATVQAVYSDMILGTSQYEAAMYRIFGLHQEHDKSVARIGAVGDQNFTKLRKAISSTTPTLNDMKTRLERLNNILGNTTLGSERFKKIQEEVKKTEAIIEKASGRIAKSTKEPRDAFQDLASLAGSAAFVAGTTAMVKGALAVTGEFQKYNSVLKISLGSQAAATKAMGMLTEYAAKTPYQLNEATSGYIKLVNRGLRPTMEEMVKFGDLASSQGKSLDQVVEATLDAMTGENERLKEFGIKASVAGDKVSLTFKGITQTVEKSEVAIQNAILAFGGMNGVAGSMAAVAETWEGQVSNLADTTAMVNKAIGDDLYGAASTGVSGIKSLLEWILKFRNENPSLFKTIVQVTAGLTLLIGVISGAAGIMVAVKMAIPVISSLGITMNLALGPIGLITGAIMALATAFLFMKNRADEARMAAAKIAAEGTDVKNVKQVIEEISLVYTYAIAKGKAINTELANSFKTRLREAGITEQKTIDSIIKKKGNGSTGRFTIDTDYIDKYREMLEAKNEAENKSGKSTDKVISGIKNHTIALQDLVNTIELLSKEYNKPLDFKADFSSIEEAKEATSVLEKFGATVSEIPGSNDGKVQVSLDITLKPGQKLNEEMQKALQKAKGFSEVKTNVKVETVNVSAGAFDPLVNAAGMASEKMGGKLNDFLKTQLGASIKSALSMIGEMANQAVALLQAKAQLASARSRSVTAYTDWISQYADKQDEKEMARLEERIKAELDALAAKNEAILAEQEEFEKRKQEIERKYADEKNLAEDENYLAEVERLQLAYENKIAMLELEYSDTQQFEIERLALMEELEQMKLNLAGQFQNAWQDEKETALDNLEDEEIAKEEDWKTRQQEIEAEKKKLESEREAREKELAKAKEERDKKAALLKYRAELAAWAASKVANIAAIRMQMAMGVMNAIAAGVSMAALGGPVGWVLGPTLAATLTGMILSTGATSMAAVAAEPPPMPPQFEKGGFVSGLRHKDGGVNANLEGGEYVMPVAQTARNFQTLEAMRTGKKIDQEQLVVNQYFTNYFYEKDNYDEFKRKMNEDMRYGVMSAVPI
ncbi:hypothetical protein ND856_18680 [Leptospira bandrabouensis]|uniref:hypothetical protein n=1 Tax=Leptospira bandrabouensis TaxID=2484903 RepID=UPI00223DFD58|nr:hypothetical protein [Leptospira bandrabouensis]MCW7460150.1 hypothetical protein [Leptospira bandrabouensis]MCW7479333.1 hypothetical protein [Leptospira bandrabouensis]MCW7487015.1 hypothetical protein [Leptospira bandrabouensis]